MSHLCTPVSNFELIHACFVITVCCRRAPSKLCPCDPWLAAMSSHPLQLPLRMLTSTPWPSCFCFLFVRRHSPTINVPPVSADLLYWPPWRPPWPYWSAYSKDCMTRFHLETFYFPASRLHTFLTDPPLSSIIRRTVAFVDPASILILLTECRGKERDM